LQPYWFAECQEQQWGELAPHEPFKAVPMQLQWRVGGGKNPPNPQRGNKGVKNNY